MNVIHMPEVTVTGHQSRVLLKTSNVSVPDHFTTVKKFLTQIFHLFMIAFRASFIRKVQVIILFYIFHCFKH